MSFYEDIASFSKSVGFMDFGVTASCVLSEEQKRLEAFLQAGHQGRMAYLERNVAMRCNPALLVENAASVWIFLAPYGPAPQQTAFARVAGFAQGEDYHTVVKNRLHLVLERIRTHFPNTQGRAFTDSAPLLERTWAVRCGLGFIGRNGLLIHPEYGSRLLIGALVLDLSTNALEAYTGQPFGNYQPPKPAHKLGCGHCHRCQEHCPGNALETAYCLDARRCISYQTLEEPAMLRSLAKRSGTTVPERSGISRPVAGWLYGCDTCQDVCPWNHKAKTASWPEFTTYQEALSTRSKTDWERMDTASFREQFPKSPLLRAGLPNLKP